MKSSLLLGFIKKNVFFILTGLFFILLIPEKVSAHQSGFDDRHSAEIDASDSTSHELLFVDAAVSEIADLARNSGKGLDVVLLDKNKDGILQITDILKCRTDLSAIHIVSHGSVGSIQLGSSSLSEETFDTYASQLNNWGNSLTDSGDILLYGCNVAKGELGQQFIDQISQLTQADVAASEDYTGSVLLGGNWILENEVGFVSNQFVLDYKKLSSFNKLLDTTTGVSNVSLSNDSGILNNDFITNNSSQSITGSVSINTAGSATPVLFVSVNNGSLVQATLNQSGSSGTFTRAITLISGSGTIKFYPANNTSTLLATISYTLDTTNPSSLSAKSVDLNDASDSGVSNTDNITNVTNPTVNVNLAGISSLVAGDVVQIMEGASVLGSYTILSGDLSSGTWNRTTQNFILNNLSIGNHSLTARIVDLAGNVGTESATPLVITIIDNVNPIPNSANASVNTLILNLTETGSGLRDTPVPPNSVFGVTQNGSAVSVTNIAIDESTKRVTLTLGTTIILNSDVLLSYSPNGAASDIQDNAGNKLSAFSGFYVSTSLPVYNNNFQPLLFNSSTNKIGNGKAVGDIVLFNNIRTIDGQVFDAIMTTVAYTGITMNGYESDVNAPVNTNFFEIDLNTTAVNGAAEYRIDFIKSGTYDNATNKGSAVILQNVVLNSWDIDAAGPGQFQFQEFGGFAKYTVATNTSMSQTSMGNNFVHFQNFDGVNDNFNATIAANGSATSDKYRVKATYFAISTFGIKTGIVTSGSRAYFYLDFSQGPAFASPKEYVNPSVNPANTANTTPTLTGTYGNFVSGASGVTVTSMQVKVNGVTYTTSSGLSYSNGNWSLTTGTLTNGIYDVAVIVNYSDGITLNDATFNELVINTSLVIDNTAPTLTSIERYNPSTTNLSTANLIAQDWVEFKVTFSETVTQNITTDDFVLTGAGSTGANITQVTNFSTPNVYIIRVSGIPSANLGSLGIGLSSTHNLVDNSGNLLTNLNPMSGTNQAYNLIFSDVTAPVIAANQNFSYAENQIADALVGTVVATDAIGVTDFRFSANGSATSADGFYTISTDGKIRITSAGVAAGVAQNDFETGLNSFTYSVKAYDEAGNGSLPVNISLNVTDLDDTAPVVTASQSFSYSENQTSGTTIATVLATDNVGVTGFRFAGSGTATSSDGYYTIASNGRIILTSSGVLAGVAQNDFETSPNSFTYGIQARDAAGNWSASQNISLIVIDINEAPILSDISMSGLEDITVNFSSVDFTSQFNDPDGNALNKIKIISLPLNGTLKLSGTDVIVNEEILVSNISNLSFVPNLNWNGVTSFDWNGYDGSVYSVTAEQVNISLTSVNDAPAFIKGSNLNVCAGSGTQSVTGWATSISTGPADESSQSVSFVVDVVSNSSVFSLLPTVSSTGVLTYIPHATNSGIATINIHIQDNGGILNGGVDASVTQTFTISVSNVAVSYSKSDVSCFGGNNGEINITPSDGISPYSFVWTGSGVNVSSEDQTGLTAGTYTVIVKDAINCTSPELTVTISEPAVITVSNVSQSTIACNGGTATVTISASGGTGALSYTFDGVTNSTGIFTHAAGTSLAYSVTDANSCPAATGSFDVVQPAVITVSNVSQSTIACNGGTATVTITASGGTAPLSYTFDGVTNSAGIFTHTAGTSLAYSVTDANSCPAATGNFDVVQPAVLEIPTGSVTVQPICAAPTGTIEVSSPLGAEYEYSLDGGTYQASTTFTLVTLGDHTLTARLASSPSCISGVSSTITVEDLNDAPVLTPYAPVLAATTEDFTSSATDISTLLGTSVTDLDCLAEKGIAIYETTGRGDWEYLSGSSVWTSIGSIPTNSAILLPASSSIRYIPDFKNGEDVSFSYYAWDQTTGTAYVFNDVTVRGGTTSLSVNNDMASLSVSSVNDAPVLAAQSPAFGTIISSSVSSAELISSFAGGAITDVDFNSEKGIAVYNTSGKGTWEYTTDGVLWTAIGVVSQTSALLLNNDSGVRYTGDSGCAETATIDYYAWDKTTGNVLEKVNVSLRGGTSAFSTGNNVASILVTDGTPPVVPTLAAITIGDCSLAPSSPTTTDNCAGTVTGTTTTTFPITTLGDNIVTWSFDDGNGNVSNADQTIKVIATPVITNPGAQAECDSYTLPTILGSNLSGSEAYYNNSQAQGGTVITGAITGTQTVWIYDTNGSCSDEESFVVTITNTPVITNPGAQAACDSYTLPAILGSNLSGSEAYYNNSQSLGGTVITGPITGTQTVWIYDTNGSCSDEESFVVTITNTPVITNPGAQASCDSYTLPAITGTNLVAAKYYDKSQAQGGTVITGPITSSQTVWIYDTNGSCSDEESFVVTITNTPVITNPGAQAECDSYTLPTILGSNLSGSEAYYNDSKANNGTVITGPINSTQTVWIYDTNGSCSDEESFVVTITNTPVITNPGAQAECDSYTLPTILGSNLSGSEAYYNNSQAQGGTLITGAITGTQTVWIYDTNGSCSDEESFVVTITNTPVITNPGAQSACDSYTLPTILGSNLSGSEAYYNDSKANNGTVITGPITSTQTVWIYDTNGICSDEESFVVTITNTPVITNPGAQSACDSYTLPTILGSNLSGSEAYYNNSQALGGTVITGAITGTQTIWIYDTNGSCSDEESFVVTITNTPVITNPGAQAECDSYTLPTILGSNLSGSEAYYNDSKANNGTVITGPITGTQTVWIYDTNGSCSDEESFVVTITNTPVITNPGAQAACDSYTLPTILGSNLSGSEAYYNDSKANNGAVITGPITSTQTVWIYDTNGSCSDEESFVVTITNTPVITNPGAQAACDSYTLPTILGSNLSGSEAYYNNSQALGGTVITGAITSSQTVWIYDTNGSCSDEESFVVTINAKPAAPIVGTIVLPTCSTSIGSVELSGLPSESWIINPGNISGSAASYTITGLAQGAIYNFTVTLVSTGCTSDVSANVAIYESCPPTVDIQGEPATVNTLASYSVTIKFSENVTGFTIADIAVGNGTASNFVAVDGNTYTVDITPSGIAGNITIDVAAAIAKDLANNDNIAAIQAVTLYDSTVPSVAILNAPVAANNVSAYTVTFEFSENVTGFSLDDITVANGTSGNFVSIGGNTYTADITPSGIAGNITIDVAASVAKDLAGNDNTAAIQAVTLYDSSAPGVVILGAPASVNNKSSYPVTIKFTENVTGFTSDDIAIGHGVLNNFTVIDGSTYTVDVTPSGNGNITLDIPAGVAQDIAGNGNLPASQVVIIFQGAGVSVSAITGHTTEAGGTATFFVFLTSIPTSDVVIGLSSSKNTEGSIFDTSLTFTSLDWNVPQIVLVTGQDDVVFDGDINYTIITSPVSSVDPNYNGLNPDDVPVINEDNEVAGIVLSKAVATTNENGSTDEFTVSLASQPLNDVQISITSEDVTEGTVSLVTLDFASSAWNIPQKVVITGVDDALYDGDISYNVTVSIVAANSDLLYSSVADQTVLVTNIDDEDPTNNTAPVVSDFSKTGNEDEILIFATSNFISHYFDLDGNPLAKIRIVTVPANGILKLEGVAITSGSEILQAGISKISFTPDKDWNGSTSFNWNGYDGTAYAAADAKVNITILSVNDAPLVFQVLKSGLEDTDRTFIAADFTNKFADVDGNSLVKIKIESLPVNGTLKLNTIPVMAGDEILLADLNKIIFSPDKDWNSSTSFNWNGFDGNTYASVVSQVNIQIQPVNDLPVSVADKYTVNEGATLTIDVPGVLANDTDVDGDVLKAVLVYLPEYGSLTLNTDGSFKYIHNGSETTSDEFTYKTNDGTAAGNLVNVAIKIIPVNDSPIAVNDNITVYERTAYQGSSLLENDSDSEGDLLTISTIPVVEPLHGTLTIYADGTFVYNPFPNYLGPDNFTYRVCDDGTPSNCSTATVTIDIVQLVDTDNDGIPDIIECPSGINCPDTDGDGIPDYQDTDADGDGIPDVTEGTGDPDGDGIPNYLDPDSDGDGIPDITEGTDDPDGDGIPNYQDTDSDGDGIPDSVEGTGDPDGDGIPNYLDPDSDGDGIPDVTEGIGDPDGDGIPNYQDTDSDGDGIPDSVEGIGDPDGDGIPNYLDTDSDGDGIPDVTEGTGDPDGDGIPNYLDTDSDGDGIPDVTEGTGDPDGDGIPNYLDADSDGDGIPDITEGTGDPDGDGIPNYLDTDSDGDGISDLAEGTGDPDGDGIPNYLDTDSDGDGIPDSVEGTGDPDGDGIPNYLDTDSDGDGIPDVTEGTGDPDGDGIPNYLDTDSDGDGIPDVTEGSGDPDGDGTPNYLDTDSDGDGIPDRIEGTGDPDGDGIPNYLDLDSDGDSIPDSVEGSRDTDGDGIPNYLDTDSDGDGIPDSVEGTIDTDGDGIPNYLDTDSDGDGIPDSVEGDWDADGDGIPNYLDLDADGDGIPDSIEGTGDVDGDGIPNFLDPDSDGDDIPDSVEGTDDFDGDGIPNYQDTDSDADGYLDVDEGLTDADQDGQPDYLDPDSDGLLPNQIFTPNGDGQNDTFIIYGIEAYPNSRVTIFNRWGSVVYEKIGYQNDWDGNSNMSKVGSKPLPVGTYYYVINYDQNKHKTGFVYLER